MHLIWVSKIQMGTWMTRMLRSADLLLSMGDLGLRQKDEGFFSQRRRGIRGEGNLEIWVMCSFMVKKLQICVNLCEI